MANKVTLAADILAMFQSTTALTATEKQRLRDRFITAFPNHWQVFLAAGNTDTAANRNKFACERTIAFWEDIYRSESYKENVAALPPVDTL